MQFFGLLRFDLVLFLWSQGHILSAALVELPQDSYYGVVAILGSEMATADPVIVAVA